MNMMVNNHRKHRFSLPNGGGPSGIKGEVANLNYLMGLCSDEINKLNGSVDFNHLVWTDKGKNICAKANVQALRR
jgi:hypothetical protein